MEKCATQDVSDGQSVVLLIFFWYCVKTQTRRIIIRPHSSYGCTKGDLYDCNQGPLCIEGDLYDCNHKAPYRFSSNSVVTMAGEQLTEHPSGN